MSKTTEDAILIVVTPDPEIAKFESAASVFQPMRMLEVELSQPLVAISAHNAQTGYRYRRARLLVRLHTQPLGLVDLHLEEDGLSATAYAGQIWRALHHVINDHLRQDGLPQVSRLDATGLPYRDEPSCLRAQNRFLETAPFASVIVCTRDRTEQLATCLLSLTGLDYPNYEIIVVDNSPETQATADLVRQTYAHLPLVRYVREDRPGLSWARNYGLQHARGEIVAYTDDDVLVDSHWLTELARSFQTTTNVACVTGLALPAELETECQIWFEQFAGFNKGRDFTRLIFNMTTHRMEDPLYPYLASNFGAGVNMAFKASELRALGGFDPALSMLGEDIEIFFRVITRGYTLVYQPTALLHHFHRRGYSDLLRQLYRYGVSFTAFLTKCLVDDPKRIFFLLSKLPNALFYLLSRQSARNKQKQASYPWEITQKELWGMLFGPLAYLRSRWHLRRIKKQFGLLET